MSKYKSLTPEERKERQRELVSKIGDEVAELTSSEGWLRYLEFSKSFHRYSLSNVLLILAQCPDATRVAGFRKWETHGRKVKKGERSIKIFGYSQKKSRVEKDETTGEETLVAFPVWYPILSVFDVSQTEGEELPVSGWKLPDGDETYGVPALIEQWLNSIGWTYRVGDDTGAAEAHADFAKKEVVIGGHLAPTAQALAALHEAAHVVLGTQFGVEHQAGGREYATHRGLAETEAQSVAFVLGSIIGLPGVDSASIPYIANWSNSKPEVIKQSAANVLKGVAILSEALGLDGDVELEQVA